MKTGITVAMVLLIALVGAVKGCEYLERPKATYASFAEARDAGALGPGKWLPEWLPESATNIVEQHDIDMNQMWLSFAFSGDAFLEPPHGCKPAKVSESRVAGPRWWRVLAEELESGSKVYSCIRRSELQGFWVKSRCSLIVGNSRAVYACDPPWLLPKAYGAQRPVPGDAAAPRG